MNAKSERKSDRITSETGRNEANKLNQKIEQAYAFYKQQSKFYSEIQKQNFGKKYEGPTIQTELVEVGSDSDDLEVGQIGKWLQENSFSHESNDINLKNIQNMKVQPQPQFNLTKHLSPLSLDQLRSMNSINSTVLQHKQPSSMLPL